MGARFRDKAAAQKKRISEERGWLARLPRSFLRVLRTSLHKLEGLWGKKRGVEKKKSEKGNDGFPWEQPVFISDADIEGRWVEGAATCCRKGWSGRGTKEGGKNEETAGFVDLVSKSCSVREKGRAWVFRRPRLSKVREDSSGE